jgi:NAD(P)-dependent dehydrogenase (short-subunit alcohol dehydrogenase family)
MAIEFDGDVVIITGAGRGLGRAYAGLLADCGARVVVNDIGGASDGTGADEGAAAAVVREIAARGGTAVADTHDAATADGAQAIADHALDVFGRLDAVVANAGILRDQAFHKQSDEDFGAVVGVHLMGTVRMFRAAYPHMRQQRYGRLVSTTSAAGLFGNFGQTAYAAAKLGIVGFTRALALEAARYDIKANVVAPAATTRMTEALLGDRAALLTPDLVAPLVACLCHRSLQSTGQVISAGGGRFARVAIGVLLGVLIDEPTPELVADSLDSVLAEQELIFPGQAMDEIALLLQTLN